ncbi:MAG: alpha/beta hydrolase [Armatimonas sp.]
MKLSRFLRSLALCLFLLVLPACVRAKQDDAPTRVRDVIYGRKLGVVTTMDVFKPAKPNGIGVIFMVSGGWVSSHEGINPELAKIFTSRGQTVFMVVHGSQPKFTLPEILQDIHRSVRFIRTHAAEYGVDPNRLAISGASAGGHLSLMMGAYGGPGDPKAADPIDRASSQVQAIGCFFPPTDFLNYGKEGDSAMEISTLKAFWPVFTVSDATPKADRDKLGRILSPIYGVTAKMPPTLIFHGDADTLVPIQQSERLMAKLEELKVPHKLEVRKGKGHGWPEIGQDFILIADWFTKYLGQEGGGKG